MPYEFKFYIGHDLHFDCKLHHNRCKGVNKQGHQCSRIVYIGTPYCWQHLRSTKHLTIKDSGIHGKGLFAYDSKKGPDDIVFRTNDKVIEYDAERVNLHTLDERYGEHNTAPYGMEVSKNKDIYEDGACERTAGTIANQGKTKRDNNCKFGISYNPLKVFLKAKRNIRNGEEILVDYGANYRFDEDTSFKTVYSK